MNTTTTTSLANMSSTTSTITTTTTPSPTSVPLSQVLVENCRIRGCGITSSVLLVLWIPFCCFVILRYNQFRRTPMFTKRNVALTDRQIYSWVIAGLFRLISNMIAQNFGGPADAGNLIILISIAFEWIALVLWFYSGFIACVRIWMLSFDLNYHDALDQQKWRQELNPADSSPYIANKGRWGNRIWVTQKTRNVIIGLAVVFFAIRIAALFFGGAVRIFWGPLIALLVPGVIIGIIVFRLWRELPGIFDNYAIRTELKILIVLFIPFGIARIANLFESAVRFSNPVNAALWNIFFICQYIGYFGVLATIVLYVIYENHFVARRRLSFRERVEVPNNVRWQHCVEFSDGYDAFARFLIREFALESLLFLTELMQVKYYNSNPQPPTRLSVHRESMVMTIEDDTEKKVHEMIELKNQKKEHTKKIDEENETTANMMEHGAVFSTSFENATSEEMILPLAGDKNKNKSFTPKTQAFKLVLPVSGLPECAFKDIADRPIEMAYLLYKKYIEPGIAPFEINIAHATREDLTNLFDNISLPGITRHPSRSVAMAVKLVQTGQTHRDLSLGDLTAGQRAYITQFRNLDEIDLDEVSELFDRAAKQIASLLRDSFGRFTGSPEFEKLWDAHSTRIIKVADDSENEDKSYFSEMKFSFT